MRFRILGPIQLGSHTPSAAKMRTVLAGLLVRANKVVAAESLIDELWGEAPPRTATTTLQVYISQLRKACAADDGADAPSGRETRIVTRSPGYLMRVGPEELDLARFESLHAQGREAFGRQDFAQASRLLHKALAVWSGPALSGVPCGSLLDAAVVSLEERRMEALEQRIAADLALGRHRELSGELMALAHEYPLHEWIHAHLMTALYRSGRQADALRAFDRIRRRLVTELGVEPGAALQELHQGTLRFDPRLMWRPPAPAASTAAPAARPAPPAPVLRLPPPVADFTGRQEVLEWAGQMLRADPAAPATRVLAVVGAAGAGKTAFAVQVARQVAESFPEGCVFVGLRGPGGRALDPAESLARLLRKVEPAGRPAQGAPELHTGVEELSDALHQAVAGRRMLLVLDDVVSEAQVRPILSAVPECVVVLTGRRMLTSLDGVRHVVLDVLRPHESAELLAATGGARITEDPAAAARIAQLCGHLPLALRVAGAGLAARPHWSAASLAERLEDERARLGILACGDLDVRATLLVGYREAGTAERQAFRLLGLAAPEFGLWQAAALLGTAPADAERVIDRLVQAHLLQARSSQGRPVRYRFHELHRAMAVELLDEEDRELVRAATARLCDAYLTLSRHAETGSTPDRAARPAQGQPCWLPDPAKVMGPDLTRWFHEESAALVAVVRQAHAARLWELTWQLADSLMGYIPVTATDSDWEITLELALDAARRSSDPSAEAAVLCSQDDLERQQRPSSVHIAPGAVHGRLRR